MKVNIRLSGSAEQRMIDHTQNPDITPKEIVEDSMEIYFKALPYIKKGGKLGVVDEHGNFKTISAPTLELAKKLYSVPNTRHKKPSK